MRTNNLPNPNFFVALPYSTNRPIDESEKYSVCKNPDICEKEYDGYIFDKIVRNDGLYQYIVYLAQVKTVSRITSRYELDDYGKYKFKIFIFDEEASLKKKVRLHIIL